MMKGPDLKFKKKLLTLRNSIEKRGITLMTAAISKQYAEFASHIGSVDLKEADQIPVNSAIVDKALKKYYTMMAPIAWLYREKLMASKKAEDDEEFWTNHYADYLSKFVHEKAGDKIKTITETSKKRCLTQVRESLDQGTQEGWGIEKIKNDIKDRIGQDLIGNAAARARAIAQTEIISGSNQAAVYAADSTGVKYVGYWSTSGLARVRPSHMDAQADGYRNPGDVFSNGLLYPGDPNGGPEEVCNCRCTYLVEYIDG